ncbi:MAG TPA: Mur ligase family protein [Candidatus Limnocylindrales bacterium]|nr:Mur ligase family protein [Candidatus Limnocylindrales bacterium]
MRLVEIRLLEGPNVYRLEPTVKIEFAVGRRRTWSGQRLPGRHAVVRLGAPVPAAKAPRPARELAAWVRRIHLLTDAGAWLRAEAGAGGRHRRNLPVAIHRGSDPGHWVVAFPWREEERARAIAEGAWRLVERGADPRRTPARGLAGAPRSLVRTLRLVREARTTPAPWIRDGERRVPVVSISGTNGKSTTTRMISHILRSEGRHVGTTTSDGVLVDGRLVEEGDWTGPSGALKVLGRSDVEVAVLETARGGILLRGVGYESNEAAVLTNVSSDHLDLQGIHTLPELAEVKSVIARITRPEGSVVLNADDPLVAAVARSVRAPVCFFSLAPGSPRVRRHLARGGRAMLLERGRLVEAEGPARHTLLDVAEAPATLLGLARHNIANALAAAGAARALGVSREAVAEGLRTFRPTAELAPGRLNLYRLGNRVVIVDFAHNEAGLTVVLDVAEGIASGGAGRRRPLTAIVGTAGDRPGDTLRGIGRIAAQRADRVAIKETLKYLRGSTREAVVGEILAGVVEGGGRRADVAVHESEAAALRAMLAEPAPNGAVVVLMCHEDRDGVAALLREAGARPVDAADGLLDLVPRLQR